MERLTNFKSADKKSGADFASTPLIVLSAEPDYGTKSPMGTSLNVMLSKRSDGESGAAPPK